MFVAFKASLGIEFRAGELLMVGIKKGLKQWLVSGFKIIPNYHQVNKSDLRREVQRFARSSGAAREQIVLGVPREQAVIRMIELPREVEENLNQVIKFQVENLTPSEEVAPYYDYSVLSRQGAFLQILLVMIKKEVLDSHLAMIHELGVQPNIVQLSTVGLSNLALSRPNMVADAINLLFNIGEKKLELVGIKHRQLWYSKHLNLTDDVPSGELMMGEIDAALSSMRLEDGQVEKIWFSGKDAEAILPDFRVRLEDSDYLIKNFKAHLPKALSPLMANNLVSTIGLALGVLSKKAPVTLNLLPKEKRIHYSKISYVPSVILGLAIIVLALAPTALRYQKDKRILSRLDAAIKTMEPEIAEIRKLRKENENAEKKVGTLEELVARNDLHLDLLKDLTVRIPDNTYITTFRLQKIDLQLGLSSTGAATALVKTLSESPYLKDVEVTSEYPDAQGRKNIQIKAKVKKES
ncbi:MAG: pilus assembly protein PilM [Acidobacteria bacterium]|nr:pilus assembly protein PilM [Acidobacteriota bacterium]MBI3658143.1 pilus assembly protein PilM [Acidobacteriota bacterium]